jgi:hypothetical protein
MDISDQKYADKNLLIADIFPSKYIFNKNTGEILSWQITMADDSIRNIFFFEEDSINGNNSGCKILFNITSVDGTVCDSVRFNETNFSKYEREITFSAMDFNICGIPCIPQVRYELSDLFFHVEISLKNLSDREIYWRPIFFSYIKVPWNDDIPFEKYVFESAAKKVLKLSESYTVISSDKHHGKISLEMLKDGAIGISQLKDNKVRICTQNEEEGLSFIIGDVTQHNIVSLKVPKDNQYLEVGIFSGIGQIGKVNISKRNDRNTPQHNGFPIAPQSNSTFSIEVSAD